MKEKNSSGNKAAITAQLEFDYIPGAPEYIEPWVTKETLRQHYKMGIRTINYAMALGLPSHHLGRNVRFKMSEVQVWLEKNGYRRFASEGRKIAIAAALLKTRQFQLALSGDVQVANSEACPKRRTRRRDSSASKKTTGDSV